MKTIKQLLEDADPVRHEPTVPSHKRDRSRQEVVTAASAAAPVVGRAPFLLAPLVTVTLVVIAVLFLGSRIWPGGGFETHAAVRFEVRLAEENSAPGMREAEVTGNNKTIFLHQEVVVSNGDIERAEVMPGNNPGEFAVGVWFTPEGTRKMQTASQNHIGKPLAILVDDKVVMAPVLTTAIGDSAVITGSFTHDQAERIVNGIGIQ